jgi:two-component system NtrC family sensor kinase
MMNLLSSTSPTEHLMQPLFTLPPQLLAKAFPFHFVFKGDRTIVQSGEVLQRLMPHIIGSKLDHCFEIKRPILKDADFAAINKQSQSIFILNLLDSEMTLKGQMMPVAGCEVIFFLGSPVVTEISQLNQIGIKLKDFAIHDSVADFLFILQAKSRLMEELAEREVKLKEILREKEEIAAIAEARARTVEQTLESLQKAQAQLIQNEKMSGLGQMVGGIAHEINNPVTFIMSNLTHIDEYVQAITNLLQLYQRHSPQPASEITDCINDIDLEFLLSDLPKIIASMKTGSTRIRDIVLSLRNFSRLDEAEQKNVDLHEGINSTLLILNHKLKPGIEVVVKYGNLPKIMCNPAQLNQVFMNIISNAVDALMESNITSKQISIQTSVDEFNCICIAIQDNGYGIPPQIQQRIFDPFFTTKPIGKGTGLGLSISHQILQNHQGTIEVISEVGKGTEFEIKIPIS